MTPEPVIQTNSLVRRFGDLIALNNLTIEVNHGEVFGFLGHNGAGKTTTIRILNGVLAPSAGSVRVLGLDPIADGPALRRRTGVLTENPSLDERLTARENLEFYAELNEVPRDRVKTRIDQLLADFELTDRDREKVGGYSKGMKQRLALARPLLHNPEIIYLDEPTAGLDPVAALHVRQLVTRLSVEEGRTIFICTHNLVEAQRLCHRVAVLEKGELIALGTPAELAQKFGHRQRLEVEVDVDQHEQTLNILNRQKGITAAISENHHIGLIGAAHNRIPELVKALTDGGVRIYRVVPEEPSLEEVYLALHGEHEQEKQA
jgi:ABC-2 type transport system ATP-binding protein